MMRMLMAECPGMRWIGTTTGAENTHMIEINHALGYSTVRAFLAKEVRLEAPERQMV